MGIKAYFMIVSCFAVRSKLGFKRRTLFFATFLFEFKSRVNSKLAKAINAYRRPCRTHNCFRLAHVNFLKQKLTIQVAQFYCIQIDLSVCV